MTAATDPAELLARVGAGIESPDRSIDESARAALATQEAALGRVGELAGWWAACRGGMDAVPPSRVTLVAFAADQECARRARISSLPSGSGSQLATALQRGETAAGAVAARIGARILVVDMGLHSPDAPTSDAATVTGESIASAIETGIGVADEQIDSGTELLIVTTIGAGATAAAAAIIGLLAPAEAVDVTGRSGGIDDATWMRKCAVVRDAMTKGRPYKGEPAQLLLSAGGPDIAAATGLLLRAAQRRTPVFLGGVGAAAAALVAHRIAFRTRDWWQAAQAIDEPAQRAALDRLDIAPLLDLRLGVDEGTGALLAVPLLSNAVAILAASVAS